MNETLKQELLDKGIMLTYEQWLEYTGIIFKYLSNKYTPEELYKEYVNEMIADYEKIRK